MNTIVSQVGETNENKEHTLCDDILRLIGKQVELIRNRLEHQQNMTSVLQSIQQTGGWGKWHYNPECPDRIADGCLGDKNDDIGIPWYEVINYKKSFWLSELLVAECSYQFGYIVI